jgi:hypothetical protein
MQLSDWLLVAVALLLIGLTKISFVKNWLGRLGRDQLSFRLSALDGAQDREFAAKNVLYAVNASLHWLNNVSGVYLIQLIIGQQGLVDFFSYRPLLPIGWSIVQILRQCRRKATNTAPSLLV